MKKHYYSPIVKSENIEIGVFGNYGSSNGYPGQGGTSAVKRRGGKHGSHKKSWWMFW